MVLLAFPHLGESACSVELRDKIEARVGLSTRISGQQHVEPSRIEGPRDLLAGRSDALLMLLALTRTYEGLWSDLCEGHERASKRGDWPEIVRLRHWGRS